MDIKTLQNIFPLRTALRVHEFCNAFGIGTTLFYSIVKNGELRTRKIGKVTVIPLSEVAAWMEKPAKAAAEYEAR
jgi:excisionase family DNA binding protein